jgi:hypothetical protein
MDFGNDPVVTKAVFPELPQLVALKCRADPLAQKRRYAQCYRRIQLA